MECLQREGVQSWYEPTQTHKRTHTVNLTGSGLRTEWCTSDEHISKPLSSLQLIRPRSLSVSALSPFAWNRFYWLVPWLSKSKKVNMKEKQIVSKNDGGREIPPFASFGCFTFQKELNTQLWKKKKNLPDHKERSTIFPRYWKHIDRQPLFNTIFLHTSILL